MSTFDDASLVFIPSGYKTSKAYSVKPSDGSGDLTFTRSNDTATRVNSAGLIEKVRTNLLTYSQDFSNAAWGKSAGATLTHSQTDPNGGTTASRLQMPSGTTNFLGNGFSGATNGGKYTHSIYMKSNTGSTQTVRILDGARGAAGGSLLASVTTSWQRFEVVITTASTSAGLQIDNAGGTYNNDILIAFAQSEETDFGATPYIATTSAAVSVGPVANVPRLDYLNSTCPRLLLEPQRTNLVTYSEQFNNAAWVKDPLGGAALTTVVTANQAVSPDGYTNADKVFMSLGGGTTTNDWARLQSATFNVTSGTAYTITFWAWASQSSEVGKKVRVGVSSNTALLDFTLTATATRFTVTYTAASTGTDSLLFQLRGAQGLSSTAEFFLWGTQLEAGAYATSYIPTLGAAVTRGADACSKTGISSLIGQTEGTLFVEATLTHSADSNEYLMQVSANGSNRFFIYREGTSNKLGSFAIVGGSIIYAPLTAAATTGTIKAAFAYKSGSFAFYVNGVQVNTSADTYTTPASMGIFDLDSNAGSENGFYSYSQALLFKTRLTNAQLAELTTI